MTIKSLRFLCSAFTAWAESSTLTPNDTFSSLVVRISSSKRPAAPVDLLKDEIAWSWAVIMAIVLSLMPRTVWASKFPGDTEVSMVLPTSPSCIPMPLKIFPVPNFSALAKKLFS